MPCNVLSMTLQLQRCMITYRQTANFILNLTDNEEEGVTNLKLQKLLYLVQGHSLALLDTPIFQSPIAAWLHGPVVKDAYHEYKKYGRNPIPADSNFSNYTLTDEQRDLIKDVLEIYGQFSAWKLRELTHSHQPWLDHKCEAGEIPQQEIKDFFRSNCIA
ncbi:hypothetical protein OMCYN_01723 [cyanobiont of Ornithocercus magnificus]|nr:hypothetical protein OMCYN_01723 [cyanobiont of Ornithocercus magnificus]